MNGFEKQLEAYKDSEQTTHGTYVVIGVGSMGRKKQRTAAIARSRKRNNKSVSETVYVDAKRRKSASNL